MKWSEMRRAADDMPLLGHPWDGKDWGIDDGLVGLVHLTSISRPGGSIKMSPPQVCLKWLNAVTEGDAKFDCLSMVKMPKVRHTLTEAPSGPRLEVRRQRR